MSGCNSCNDFLGIGAHKSATTWLFEQLKKHPDIWMPPLKELHYFDARNCSLKERIVRDARWRRRFKQESLKALKEFNILNSEYRKKIKWEFKYFFSNTNDNWYASLFKQGSGKMKGDITPDYSILNKTAIQRIATMMPSLKIIFVMRNPIERAWSQAKMHFTYFQNRHFSSVSELLQFLDSRHCRIRGDYLRTLNNWQTFYPQRQLFIGFYEDIALYPHDFLIKLYRFLEVDASPQLVPEDAQKPVYMTPSISAEISQKIAIFLAKLYYEQIKKLYEMFGKHTEKWLEQTENILKNDTSQGIHKKESTDQFKKDSDNIIIDNIPEETIKAYIKRCKSYKEINIQSLKKYPKVIQFPITFRCNSRCVMCNVWKMDHKNEMSMDEIARYMKDSIFKEVESVGINGGEPLLVSNLPKIVEQVLTLPRIKNLNIISNGYNKESILDRTENIYSLCREKNIQFHLSISLDGYGQAHDRVRGVKNAFKKTTQTIDHVLKKKERYCDSIDIGCTVVKQNVDFLAELDTFASIKKYPMKYRLGIENNRIASDKSASDYSVLYDSNKRQAAAEFFDSLIAKTQSLNDKFKYFSIFYFLTSKNPMRLSGCRWQEDGITLDPKGDIYYCAVASKKIGSLREKDGESIYFDKENLRHRDSIIQNRCKNCVHDYSGMPYRDDFLVFLKEASLKTKWTKIYEELNKELSG